MTVTMGLVDIPPDLRLALAAACRAPGQEHSLRGLRIRVDSVLPAAIPIPPYLRYADRDAVLTVYDENGLQRLEAVLDDEIRDLGDAPQPVPMIAAVLVLSALDECFRTSGLWQGNIYLAGMDALGRLLALAAGPAMTGPRCTEVLRELGALELIYLFPIAPKFRDGAYDGQVQYRLNGWGRVLARRLRASTRGYEAAERAHQRIGDHLRSTGPAYAAHLHDMDLVRQEYNQDLVRRSMALTIPVLV